MSGYYRLEGRSTVPCDMMEWAKTYSSNRPVADDMIGDVRVYTIFLGVDHSYGGVVPILFETMIFSSDPELDQQQWRYSTWESAEAGHKRVLSALHEGRDPEQEVA